MKKKRRRYGNLFFAIIISLIAISWLCHFNELEEVNGIIPCSVAYLEDRSGSLTIEEITAEGVLTEFSHSPSAFLTFGASRSVWWVRVEGASSKQEKKDLLLSVNNPSIQYITAYIPTGDDKGFAIKHSGWGYRATGDPALYQAPVFKIPEPFDKDSAIYLRVQSIYPHNYDVRILTENQFYNLQQQNMIFIGVLLGVFLTMALLNGIIYVFFRETTYLYYAVYASSMLVFQAVSMGVTGLFTDQFASVMAMNQGLFSCIMLMTSLGFVKAFMNTRQNAPKHHIALNVLMAAFLLNVILMFSGWRFGANIATDYLGYATVLLTLSVAIHSVRKKVKQANYFLFAWMVLIIGGLVFILRNMGILPNSFLVQHFMLMAAAGEALLIFAALVDRAKILWEEKQHTLKLLQEAETSRKNAEISFLQAQIKPHFLYNTLSVIAALTIKNPTRAKELLYHLSDYLRGSFHFENDQGMTTLAEELKTVRAYLAIEKERFRNKLVLEYDIDESVNTSIPLLTIQPLVENALRHGIFKRPGGGFIRIRVERQSGYVMVQVQDDGVGISEGKLTEIFSRANGVMGVGLWNINERLMLHYEHGLEIESREDGGTSVTVRIPMEEGA